MRDASGIMEGLPAPPVVISAPTVASSAATIAPVCRAGTADRPGDDFTRRGNIRPILIKHGWKLDQPGENEKWTRPGKETGTSATLKDGVFFVFTSSMPEFEAGKGYSQFQVLTILEYGGDFSTAAAALCRDGFGNHDVDRSQFTLCETSGSELLFAGEILARYTTMRTPIIHGLLRNGEVMNVIAPPKTGKSWLTLNLALSIVTGKDWLGFKTEPGRVLILDNELHGETVGNRLPKVADTLGIPIGAYADQIAYRLLRGQLKDVYSLAPLLQSIRPGFFKIIILDAFYRFLPKDTDENDNGSMAALYNQIDRYAGDLSCAFILIHHTSKGLQTGRAVTDVGAGAGAISRAADCHLILRPHKEASAIVLDATPRSWPPVPSCCLRFKYPLWTPAPDLDPSELQSSRPAKQKRDVLPIPTATQKGWTRKRFVADFITNIGRSKPAILAAVEDSNDPDLSRYRAEQFMEMAEGVGEIYRWDNGAKKAPFFATVPQPKIIENEREGESGFALEVNSKATHPTPSLKNKRRKCKPKPNGDKVPA